MTTTNKLLNFNLVIIKWKHFSCTLCHLDSKQWCDNISETMTSGSEWIGKITQTLESPFSPLVSSDQGAYSSDMSGWTLDSTQDDLCPSYKSTGNFWLGRQWQFHLWHIGTISFTVNKLAKKGQKILRGKLFWECSPPPSQPSGDPNRPSGGPSGQQTPTE